MIFLFLIIAIIAALAESRSESWNSFLGFVMLGCLALALAIAIVGIL
jgi:hypothetical protein